LQATLRAGASCSSLVPRPRRVRLGSRHKEQLRSGFRFRSQRPPFAGAFTLIELLVVIAVAGILAAIAIPALKEFGRSNQQVSATRQMLDAVGRARQLAIANRTTVYMVFLPNGYLTQAAYGGLTPAEKDKALRLAAGQGRSYALVSLRGIGDQPGQPQPRYLSEWQTLPSGWIFAPSKFDLRMSSPVRYTNYTDNPQPEVFEAFGFLRTVQPPDPEIALPFPSAQADLQPGGRTWILPYVAFDHTGKLVSGKDEYIPLARGTVDPARDSATRAFLAGAATVTESPPGNSQDVFNLIRIDWLTGRAKLKQQEILP